MRDRLRPPVVLPRFGEALAALSRGVATLSTLRGLLLRFGLALALVAVVVEALVGAFFLLPQRETVAARRLSDLALPLAVQFRELVQAGLAPDQALDRLRPQSAALGLYVAVVSPGGRVLRDNGGGLLEGAETGLRVEQLSTDVAAPQLGTLDGPGGQRYRYGAVGLAGSQLVPSRPDLGGLLVAERADVQHFGLRAYLQPVVLGGLVGLAMAVALGLVLARRLSRPAERLVAEAQGSAFVDGGALPSGGPAEVEALADRLGIVGDELRRVRQATRGFVMALGQAVREPLSNVRAGLREIVRASDASAEERQVALQLLDQELRRLQQLVAQLLALARLQTRQVEMAQQAVDLVALATETVDAAAATARERGVGLLFDSDGQPAVVLGDPDRLEQAVRALVEHGLRECPPGGEVTVGVGLFVPEDELAPGRSARRVSMPALHVWLSVHYPGSPAQREDAQHLFDLAGLAGADDGAVSDRLGLAIAREIVRAHGGKVLAEGDAVVGVRLALVVPAAKDAAPAAP
ncbi:MAG: hypothetical protein HY691_15225 [Chloroflexi bacterium]|nr:hypothetical protein [Chloroflexota bacterium]